VQERSLKPFPLVLFPGECDSGIVRGGDGPIAGDILFTPEVCFNGSFHPICLADIEESMVAATCKAAGFPDGGYLIENADKFHSVDAFPVQS
jgi:hypothetical protein